MFLQEGAGARTLGALLAQDLILLRRELGTPLGVGLFDLELFGGVGRRSPQPTEAGQPQQASDRGDQNTAVDHDVLRDSYALRYGISSRKLHRRERIILNLTRAMNAHRQRAKPLSKKIAKTRR